ncbi:MAG: S8 family peptidase [Clostridium sp.]|nr:S8 family peptidase [Clostridium sp.]
MYDDGGHGTHVAGCLCGSGRASNGKYRGMAPASKLVVGKVLDYKGDGNIENMAAGMEWILDNMQIYNIRILNISIGMDEHAEKSKIEKLVGLVDEAWDRGLVVVCAAGNMGPDPMTISPLGARKQVITVGCHEGGYFGNREHLCEDYSSRGPSPYAMKKPDVVAPGTDIVSCSAGITRRGRYYKNAYIAKSGTSMAAPIVSGALALLFQKYPYYTNNQAKQKLLYTSRDLNEPWNKQGWGMIQVDKLLK